MTFTNIHMDVSFQHDMFTFTEKGVLANFNCTTGSKTKENLE